MIIPFVVIIHYYAYTSEQYLMFGGKLVLWKKFAWRNVCELMIAKTTLAEFGKYIYIALSIKVYDDFLVGQCTSFKIPITCYHPLFQDTL